MFPIIDLSFCILFIGTIGLGCISVYLINQFPVQVRKKKDIETEQDLLNEHAKFGETAEILLSAHLLHILTVTQYFIFSLQKEEFSFVIKVVIALLCIVVVPVIKLWSMIYSGVSQIKIRYTEYCDTFDKSRKYIEKAYYNGESQDSLEIFRDYRIFPVDQLELHLSSCNDATEGEKITEAQKWIDNVIQNINKSNENVELYSHDTARYF